MRRYASADIGPEAQPRAHRGQRGRAEPGADLGTPVADATRYAPGTVITPVPSHLHWAARFWSQPRMRGRARGAARRPRGPMSDAADRSCRPRAGFRAAGRASGPRARSRAERKIGGGRDSSTRRHARLSQCLRTRRPLQQVRRSSGGAVPALRRRAVGTTASTTAGAPLPPSPRGPLMAASRRPTVGHSGYGPTLGPIRPTIRRGSSTAAGLARRSVADADGPEPAPLRRSAPKGRPWGRTFRPTSAQLVPRRLVHIREPGFPRRHLHRTMAGHGRPSRCRAVGRAPARAGRPATGSAQEPPLHASRRPQPTRGRDPRCRPASRARDGATGPHARAAHDALPLVMWMTWPCRQAQVLRALRVHRMLDAEQLRQIVFRRVSQRSCQRCLTTLYRRGLVVRAQPTDGRFGGSYNDGLAPAGPPCRGSARIPRPSWCRRRRILSMRCGAVPTAKA